MKVTERKATLSIALVIVALVAVCMVFVYSGVYSVAATKWHPAIEGELLHKVMVRVCPVSCARYPGARRHGST